MSSTALTIFVLFFGIALLDALRNGQWGRALFWVVVGVVFVVLDQRRKGRLKA